MNALPLMAQAAAMFCERLRAEPACAVLPAPDITCLDEPADVDLRWENVLLRSRTFRRAHVETFHVPGRLSVLHVCVFPHLDDPSPIYGFDMVAGPSRVTGIFLDLSPVILPSPAPDLSAIVDAAALSSFAIHRALPEWGDIFSNDMLAVRPVSLDEVHCALGLAQTALKAMLQAPRSFATIPKSAIVAGQNRYISGQCRNEHTFRMLSGFVGPQAARRFIDEVLFPRAEIGPNSVSPPGPPAVQTPHKHLEHVQS